MKKSAVSVIVIVIILIVAAILIFGGSSNNGTVNNSGSTTTPTTGVDNTPSAPVSETTKVNGKTSEYQNSELGFSVKYPSAWEKNETNTGVAFIMPIDKTQVSSIAKLESDVDVYAGKCSFPPVTTIKDRGTITLGGQTANMISMSNSVQGRTYFNRMYSLEKSNICYLFTFSSITNSASSKGLTGSNLTQAENNNKAIVNSADTDFTTMVKTFAFVTGPQGVDETKANPKK